MNSAHLVIQSLLLPLVSMWVVAPLFVSRPRGMFLRFAMVFLGFFLFNMYFLTQRYDLLEATLRSAAVGVVPLIAGYLWARYGLPRLR
jgi:hypothetical protein